MVFVIGQMIWISAIYRYCGHLLPFYISAAAPATVAYLLMTDSISIPSYPWLWAILISYQACCFAIPGSGAITNAAKGIGTIASMCILAAPCTLPLALWVCVVVCSYLLVCFMGVLLLAVVYPRIVVKNYTLRWRRL